MFGFPKNPSNGMIFEASPGLFFEFSASEDCWIRVDGLEALGLATVTKDGLMSPDDLKKLNGLIIPPPQSTIKGEECKTAFTQGKVRLTSTDGSLEVNPSLQLLNKGGGFVQPWLLHENTTGYDFKLNFDAILTALKQNGKFTQVQIQGRQGLKGDPGVPGISKLDTGPKGEQGPPGKNAPFRGVIATEPNALQLVDDNANRAIVDIQTVSGPDGNFLVATRANIGNPGACPQEVTPKDITSPQVLVLDRKENALVRTLEQTNDCNNPCTICVTSLHYVNMELLLDSMFERFLEQLAALKAAKEELATTWLQTMIAIFNEQKAALCCSLENCKSTARNSAERRYIEQQRIQAAQSNQQLVIDGQNDRQTITGNPDKSCTIPLVDAKVRRGSGCDCVLQFTLDGKAHATDPRGLFLDRPPAIVNTGFNNTFIPRNGVLDVHSEMSSTAGDVLGPGVPIVTTRVINVDTGTSIPSTAAGFSTTVAGTPPASSNIPQAGTNLATVDPNVPFGQNNVTYTHGNQVNGPVTGPVTVTAPSLDPNLWKVTIDLFSAIVNPVHTGTITITIVLTSGETIVATFVGIMDLARITTQTITIPIKSFDAASLTDLNTILANQANPLQMAITIDTSVTFSKDELATSVAADYTLGQVRMSNSNDLVAVDLTLQGDWTANDWSVDNTTSQGSNNGFIQLSLPAGEYVAEIIDCCVDMTNTRHIWQGTAAIEYNTFENVTNGGGTVGPEPFTTRATVMFPDLGAFNNNADARTKYLGSTISFTHQGGQIRAWVVDPDSLPSNNEGSITVCIKAAQCVENLTGSVPIDSGAIYVYDQVISPLTLRGIIHPFVGTIDAVANYGYGEVTSGAEDIKNGPRRSMLTTKQFFYHGPDGLSFFTVHGGTGQSVQNQIKMGIGTYGNKTQNKILVADDPNEVNELEPNTFSGLWTIGTDSSDGAVLGYFDAPNEGAAWAITVTASDFGLGQLWEAEGSDGNRFTIAFDVNGIGKKIADKQIIFTPIRTGCVMSFKQIQWLERGHRTGAACSAVVNIDGVDYIIVKRSLDNDITCGGGESLSNSCIAQYIAMGAGHPAIAWPTSNGEEMLGIPTSGGHGFVFDQAFSDRVLAKIAAGEMTNVTGDPKANIPFILIASA